MSMFTNAIYDYDDAKSLYDIENKKANVNDAKYNNVCYHLQQCIEKCLKYILDKNGVQYQYVHDIGTLVLQVKQLNIITIDKLLDNILNEATAYTAWEAKVRYAGKIVETKVNIEQAFDYCDELIKYCNTI